MKAIFIGPEKTGTSWVHQLLNWRGDVVQPDHVKETYFFDRSFDRGLSWYASHFSRGLNDAVEVAPSYFRDERTAERIHATFPEASIIVTLRNPISRTISMYQHLRSNGWTDLPFVESLRNDSQLLSGSLYSENLSRWKSIIPEEQLHVLSFEQMKSTPQSFADQISAILEVDDREVPDNVLTSVVNSRRQARSPALAQISRRAIYLFRRCGAYRFIDFLKNIGIGSLIWNNSSGGVQLDPDERRHLYELLKPEIECLYRLHGIDYRYVLEDGKT